MNANLNLASKPFNNRALPWILTVVILFVSLLGLIVVFQLTSNAKRETQAITAEVNRMKQEEQGLLGKAEEVKQSLTPQQQQTLLAAHRLVDRRSFSWSRLLADLEAALPDNVRVSRIGVREVSSQGGQTVADLELVLFSKGYDSIDGMIADMDRQGVFHANLVSQNLQKGRGEVGTEFELTVVYRPRPSFASESIAEIPGQTKSTGETK